MTLRFNYYRLMAQMMFGVLLTGFVSAEPPSDSPNQLPKGVLGKLASEQFKERQKAYAEAKKWSVENLKTSPELLYIAWQKSEDPEVKTRCYILMKEAAIVRKFGKGPGFVGIIMEGVNIGGGNGEPGRVVVKIFEVKPDTPAEKSGLKIGDVIVGIDDCDFNETFLKQGLHKVPKRRPLVIPGRVNRGLPRHPVVDIMGDYIKAKEAGDVVTLHMLRQGKELEKKITLMRRPAYADLDAFGRMQIDPRKDGEDFFEDWLKGMEK